MDETVVVSGEMSLVNHVDGETSLNSEIDGQEQVVLARNVGTSDHRELTNRNDADQHSIEAITGLLAELNARLTELQARRIFVPLDRKVNGKTLEADVVLSASDVGAISDSVEIPSKTSDLTNDAGYLTLATLPIYDGGVS